MLTQSHSSEHAFITSARSRTVKLSKEVEHELCDKVAAHNAVVSADNRVVLSQLKTVYSRGASVYRWSNNYKNDRNKLSMLRVDAFLRLLRTGLPAYATYEDDNDLLPDTHALSTFYGDALAAFAHRTIAASVTLKLEDEYESPEHAIIAMAELSGKGYEIIPALRAAWLRGIRDHESPFDRTIVLASALYKSKDADLLPREAKVEGAAQ